MEDIAKIQTLVGESITKEDLCYVDCYVHHHMGLFIPSVGFCQYAIQEGHTHPAYMIINPNILKGPRNILSPPNCRRM